MATLSPLFLNSRASSSFAGEFPAHSIRLPAPATAKFRPRYNQLTVKAAVSESGIYLLDNDEAEKVNRLKLNYLEKIVPVLKQEFKYTNVHQIPKVKKIVVNVGMGDAAQNAKGLDAALNDLAMITGQRPVKTTAKNAIAAFKIREGQTLGIAVTLRRDVMYAFLDRLINLGLPRVKDFQGVSPNCFDGHGNYSIGLQELTVFPELGYDAISRQRGMNVCITTTATTDKEGFRLLALMGMPFTEGTAGQETFTKKKKLRAHHFDSKAKQRSRR